MEITDHFTLEELTWSYTAQRLGIRNTPDAVALHNLVGLATLLEGVRALCGHRPVHVSSGYRSPALNQAVNGAAESAHIDGRAGDFRIPGFGTPREVAERVILSDLPFDKVILEAESWIHIQTRDNPRRLAFVATFETGRPTYRAWEGAP